jgi:hypothetical protein
MYTLSCREAKKLIPACMFIWLVSRDRGHLSVNGNLDCLAPQRYLMPELPI